MSRCRSDRVLLVVALGEGTAAEREHIASCEDCARRYEGMTAELETIGNVLRAAPPAAATAQRPLVRFWRWVWVPALAAASIVVVARLHTEPSRIVENATERPATGPTLSAYAAGVSAAVFDGGGGSGLPESLFRGIPPAPPRDSEIAGVEGALGSGTACTGHRLLAAACNDYTSALFF